MFHIKGIVHHWKTCEKLAMQLQEKSVINWWKFSSITKTLSIFNTVFWWLQEEWKWPDTFVTKGFHRRYFPWVSRMLSFSVPTFHTIRKNHRRYKDPFRHMRWRALKQQWKAFRCSNAAKFFVLDVCMGTGYISAKEICK